MRILPGALVVGIAITLAACAATPTAPSAVVIQELLLRTDPAGAACSVMQQGAAVASVASTPGIAMVPRSKAPIDVVCRKEGYLEQGMTLPLLPTAELDFEQGATLGQASAMMAYGMTMAFPPIALLTVPALAVAGAGRPKGRGRYAYMTPPEFVLTPDTFASEAARDAFFEALKDKLQAAARVRHTYIDEHCRFWPCTPSDPVCRDPVCERQRALVDEQLKSQLDQIPALRARVRILAAPGGLLLE
jgi:hypothetical protein